MISILKKFTRDFSLALSGAQETIVTIAEQVNQHVQKVKLNLDASALEKEIQEDQINLGKKIYEHSEVSLNQLYEQTEVHGWIDNVLKTQKELEATESIVSPYETLHDFERLLIRSDFSIQNIVISKEYSGIGLTIKELKPPSQMLIFFIKKRDEIVLAYGNVKVNSRDEVTFLCEKEHIQSCIAFWR